MKSKKGMGMNAIERKPSSELAHPVPRFLYIAGVLLVSCPQLIIPAYL